MKQFETFWTSVMDLKAGRFLVLFTLLVIGLVVVYYIAGLLRGMAVGKSTDPTDYIEEFQQLRRDGKLDDEEFARLAEAIPKHILLEAKEQVENPD